MKGLLHSKRFRNNLYKWLFAYVGVLLLLTVVVTYSKYISKHSISDDARSAVFSAVFNRTTTCKENEEALNNVCVTAQVYRPTSDIEYEFSFDTTGTEVNTYLVLRATIDEKFEVIDFLIDGKSYKDNKLTSNIIIDNNVIKITGTIKANEGSLNNYKVVVRYKNDNMDKFPEEEFKKYMENVSNIVQVSYSAEQIEVGGN